MDNCMPSKWFKMTNCKIPHLNFSEFLRESETKVTGKTAIWTISSFYPLPSRKKFEKHWAKHASSYVMDWQHSIGREVGFLNRFLEIPIIFCYSLSEICK